MTAAQERLVSDALDRIAKTPARMVFAARPGIVAAHHFSKGRVTVAFRKGKGGVRAEFWPYKTFGCGMEVVQLAGPTAERAACLIDRKP